MCRRAVVSAVACVLAVAATAPVSAQRAASPAERAQERRVDSIVAHLHRAKAELDAYDDSVARQRARMDTVQAGSLRLFVEASLRSRVEPAARVAAARVEAEAGPAAARLTKRWVIVRQLTDSTPDSIVVATAEGPKSPESLQIWGAPDDSLLTVWIHNDAMHLVAAEIPKAFKEWLYAELLPDSVNTVQWTNTRLVLVSSYSTVAHRCYSGDIPACSIGLRLTEVSDPVMEWYDDAGRRRVVSAWLESRRYDRRRPEWDQAERCGAGADAACIAALRQWRGLEDPVPPGERMILAKLAVQMGGPGAYERILSATGTPAQRLAAAAGVPIDSVLRVWQRRVHDTRLPSEDFSVTIAATSLAWILACGALSLRSSRWR